MAMSENKKDWLVIVAMFGGAFISTCFLVAWYRYEKSTHMQAREMALQSARIDVQRAAIEENTKRMELESVADRGSAKEFFDYLKKNQESDRKLMLEIFASRQTLTDLHVRSLETQKILHANQLVMIRQLRDNEKAMRELMANQIMQSDKQDEQTRVLTAILKQLKNMPTVSTRTVYREGEDAWVIEGGRWVPVPVYSEKR